MRITAQNQIDIKPQLADLLSNLEVGDTVRGKIIEMLGESISLRTASGQMFTAALMTDAQLKQGQSVELVISNINDDGIFAELKSDASKPAKVTEEVKLQQVLEQMDIKPEKSNIQAAKLLIKYNMPITKENIQQLVNTQKSIETLAKADVVKALSLMQSEQDLNNTEVTKLVKQAIIMEPKGQEALSMLQQTDADVSKTENAEPQKPIISDAKVNKVYSEENIDMPKEAADDLILNKSHADSQQTVMNKPLQKPKQTLQQLVLNLNSNEIQESAPKVEKLIDAVVKVFEAVSKAKPEHSAYLISKDVEVTPAAIKSLVENVDSKGKLGEQVKELEKLVDVLEQNDADVKDLKQTVKKLFLKPENLQDKEQVQETIKEIVKTAGKIESLIRAHGLEDKIDKSVLSDIKVNLNFQQNINANMNYIQIPLLINEKKTTADLYVFSSKKKGKAVNPENASILISLDLERLGHLESMISVSKKAVNLTFKVEKDKFKQLISSSIDSLKQALEARGYTLGALQVIDIKERFNLLELEEATSTIQNKMHLDIKV